MSHGGRAAWVPVLATVLCAGTILTPAVVHADEAADAEKNPAAWREAKRLFDLGRIAFRAKRYEEAILRWQESFAISGKPLILWNIANAFEELDQPDEALSYLKRWKPHAPDDERTQLDERMAKLEAIIAARPAPAPPPDPPSPVPDQAKPPAETEPAATDGLVVAGWSLVGIGGAAVVTGVVLDVVAASMRPAEEDFCRTDGDRLLCSDEGRADISNSNTLALAGDVTWIAGAAVAATGVVLVLVSTFGSDAEEDDTAGPELSPYFFAAPGRAPQGGLDLRLTF